MKRVKRVEDPNIRIIRAQGIGSVGAIIPMSTAWYRVAGHLPGFETPRDAVAYIIDCFPIVRRRDEEKYGGDYRTKRVILEIYDDMQEAIRTGPEADRFRFELSSIAAA